MFRDVKKGRSYYYDRTLLRPRRKKRRLVPFLLVVLLIGALGAGGYWVRLRGGVVPSRWLDQLPVPKHLQAVRFVVNGQPQRVVADASLQVNPRDRIRIVGVQTDGWLPWGVTLESDSFEVEKIRQQPVQVSRLWPGESFETPKKAVVRALFFERPLGKVELVVRLNPRDWLEKANSTRDSAKKVRFLTQALADDPHNVLIKLRLAEQYARQKKYQAAIGIYKEILKLGASRAILEKVLNLYEKAGKTDGVLETYIRLLQLNPEPATFNAMLDYLQKHRSPKRTILFLEKHGSAIPKGLRTYYYLFLAQAYSDARSWAQAADAYQKALKTGSRDPNIYYNLAVACEQSDNVDGAIRALRQYLKVSPKDVDSWMHLAKLYQKKGDRAAEVKVYKKVLKLQPGHEEALLELVASLEKAGDSSALVRAYEKLARLKPDDRVVQFNLGVLYYQGKEWKKAIRAFEKAAELDPKDIQSRKYLLDLYGKTKNSVGRVLVLKELVGLDPGTVDYYQMLADIYNKNKDYKEMAEILQAATARFPDNKALYEEQLYVQLKLDNRKGALQTLQALIRIDARNKDYLRQAARLYESLKQYQEALKMLQRLLKLDPNDKKAADDYLRLRTLQLESGPPA